MTCQKKYDINLINVEISLRYMINKILEAII